MYHVDRVTIGKFSELTGYSAAAVNGKIARGDWLEDREYAKAPDGRILIILSGYDQWAQGTPNRAFGRPRTARSKSTSATGTSAAASG